MEGFVKPSQIIFEGKVAENWRRFKQKYEIFVVASGFEKKSNKEKCCMLLNLAGEQAIEISNTFTYDEKDEVDDPKVLMQKFDEYCNPKRNITYERHLFNTRIQNVGETIDAYVTELRLQAKNCEFGILGNELIRDRIVVGIRDDAVRSRLLREADLDLQKAIDICRAAEQTRSHMDILKNTTKTIDEVTRDTSKSKSAYMNPKKTRTPNDQRSGNILCKYCGISHQKDKNKCPAVGKTCKKCGKKNHFAKVCKSVVKNDSIDTQELYVGVVERGINSLNSTDEEWNIALQICSNTLKFKLDTGAKCNVIPKSEIEKLHYTSQLKPTNTRLVSYSGNLMELEGTIRLPVRFKGKQYLLQFYVVDKPVQAILGLKACEELKVIQRVEETSKTLGSECDIFNAYEDVFSTDSIGCLPVTHHIEIDKNIKPVVHAPRQVPAPLRLRIREELDRMEKLGVVTPITSPTEWVSSLVTVVKPNKIRLCIDPKDLNEAVKREHYPMKTVDDVLTRIPGAKIFSTLDATNGFWQIPLDEESSSLTCFNTPFGRYKFNRLPFGIKSAPEVYQRVMEELFQGIEGCEVIVDDLMVWGRDEREHDERLKNVLDRAREVQLKLNKKKCKIRVTQVSYIGHLFTADGVKPDSDKVQAVLRMPEPTTKQDLQRFIGMIKYLAKFIPNLSEKAAPPRSLLENTSVWQWNDEHRRAYQRLKEDCAKQPTLQYYDVSKPVKISCDSSKSGLGAFLEQDGHPVAYASRALSDAQQRYAQIEKELLAIVFACEKFYHFIYGKNVEVKTDHKPLESIFKKSLNDCPMRLQRMLLRLQQYDLQVTYKKGTELYVADALSRAYQEIDPNDTLEEELEIHVVLPISAAKLKKLQEETEKDPVLQRLKHVIVNSWPQRRSHLSPSIQSY